MFSVKQPEKAGGDPDLAKQMQWETIKNVLLFAGIVVTLRLSKKDFYIHENTLTQ